jgi:ubiquinone/menaquinone biosynthesis C-methylase UbiE
MPAEKKPEFFTEAQGYFEFLSKLGLTKHLGSMQATRKLVDLSHIRSGQCVLEVGCGVGATVCYLAKSLGCRVVGVDVVERMLTQARARARSEQVMREVAFAVGDARTLPFADESFDAVLMESVNVFFEDKRQAINEYVRVTKPGGYVGLTEMTWLETSSAEMADYYKRVVHAGALDADGWRTLLADAGLEDVTGSAQSVEMSAEARGRIERYGCRWMLGVMWRALGLFLKDRDSRAFLQDVTQSLPRDFTRGMGYGVYAGRKA